MLAQRTRLFSTSGTAAARVAAQAAAASGREVIDLTSGEIWAELAPSIRAGAMAAIERGANRYTDTIGLADLRDALAQKVSTDSGAVWNAEEIAVTAGAKQALFNAAMVLIDAGDEVIIPSPYWSTFPAQVLIAGGKPVFVDSRANGYVPRVADIEAAITPATRAIVVNTPANPTGAVFDRATLAGIAELALARDLWVIFDECYAAFAHAPHVHDHIVAVAPELRARTLIVNAFSKQLALTGWRIGYLAGPKEVIKAVRALQSHTTSNPNVIAQHAVLAHLRDTDGAYERDLRHRISLARCRGLEILSALKDVPLPPAQGGFYFYLDLAELLKAPTAQGEPRSADDVVASLLAQGAVATVSGTAFGDRTGLRLSYGAPLEQLEQGLHRIVEVLNAPR